jgi:hypothetical protein
MSLREGLTTKEGRAHKEATYETFLRAQLPRCRDYSRMGAKAKKDDVATKE